MNPKNKWLDNEIRMLKIATNMKQKKYDTNLLLKFLFLLLPLLLFASTLHGTPTAAYFIKHRHVKQSDGGVYFTCKKCRTSQWQDRSLADWRGNFYCRNCGCKMGDE